MSMSGSIRLPTFKLLMKGQSKVLGSWTGNGLCDPQCHWLGRLGQIAWTTSSANLALAVLSRGWSEAPAIQLKRQVCRCQLIHQPNAVIVSLVRHFTEF